MRRKGQCGSIFQKSRRRDEEWLSGEPAYLRFWQDIPGQLEQRREVVPLGICRTRTIAERQAAEKLEQTGVNSAQRFNETNSRTTFRHQGEWWLKSLSKRKRIQSSELRSITGNMLSTSGFIRSWGAVRLEKSTTEH
jgi:hypothetical protein